LLPLLHGGGQEFGLRAGSENTAAIVGFGHAAELAAAEWPERQGRMLTLRQRLEQQLQASQPELVIFSQQAERLSNTVYFALPMIDGETLVMALDEDGFAVASGSACSSRDNAPSHVLLAMGVDADLARCAIRVSLGTQNNTGDVDRFVDSLKRQVHKLSSKAALAW
jgi:cysteine desulfurase